MEDKSLKKISLIQEKALKIGDIIYKYRYYIAIAIFILCIIFEISGSSIGVWKNFINSGEINDGVLFGTSREIRSDEWAVLTPMSFSQNFDGFKYFSDLIRGGNTDVFMVYGLPTLNLMQIFRPFQIGFLFLGIAKGLSFFWCGRFIALFMVTFEFGMIITRKNKLLSFIAAIIVTLSPMIQWWFSACGIVEIFVFGELAIILLYKYMNYENFKKRCLCLIGLVVCAGGYIMTIYPAWQVPMAYVFLALAIAVIVSNRKKCKMNKRNVIAIAIAILILVCSIGYIFLNSLSTIKSVTGTVYPGARFETGGNNINRLYTYIMNIFLPTKDIGLITNACEESTMFSLFPMGLILSLIVLFRDKKKDLSLILLLIVDVFLSLWVITGFPGIIAKLTLLSNSQAPRTILAVGFVEILLIIRSLTLMEKPFKKWVSLVISVIVTAILVLSCINTNVNYYTINMKIAMCLMCMYLFYFLLRYKAKYAKYFFVCGITFVMIMSGATVNPIRTGTDVIYKNEIIKKVQEIQAKDDGKWIVEGLSFPNTNYILMAGVPVINSTNTYPNMEIWRKYDNGKYEDIYNRYAHIEIKLVEKETEYEDKFILKAPDSFIVYLLPEELKKIDVKYIFTINDLEKYKTDSVEFNNIYNNEQYKIYEIHYNY